MTGPLVLAADPQTNLQAATKNYVDMLFAVGLPPGGPFLPLAGNATVWGPTTFSASGAALSVTNNATVGGTLGVTGAINGGSLQLHNQPFIHSIAESGAVGDGVTDDQPAIQAWLNTLTAGAEVILPPGKWYYIHASYLIIPPNITVRGAYNTKDNQYAGGNLLGVGGFLIDPTLICGIIMTSATSLRQVKVYRSGLTPNCGDTQAQTEYGNWAAEGIYKKTNGAISNGSTTIPLSDTSGISVGMPLSGVGTMAPLIGGTWNYRYVTAITPGVSVTINIGMSGAKPSGIWVRFGSSIGVVVNANCSGITLEDVTVIGFRTGIQVYPGQFSILRMMGDCITNLEVTSGGSWSSIRDCLWIPLYGTAGAQYVRPGDMVFIHDCQGPNVKACYGVGWNVGWHIENTQGPEFTDCGAECPPGITTPGTTNWMIRGGSQAILINCHCQTAGTGFHLDGTNQYLLYNCSSSGNQTTLANNVAHFFIENVLATGQCYGSIIAPEMLGGYPNKVPLVFGSGTINSCNLVGPSMQDMTSTVTVPFVSGTLPATLNPTFNQGVVYQGNLPLSGTVITANAFWNGVIVDSTHNPLTNCTVTLPAHPMDGQTFMAVFNTAVTTLTVSTSDGSAIGNYTAAASAGTLARFLYNLAQNKWFVGV